MRAIRNDHNLVTEKSKEKNTYGGLFVCFSNSNHYFIEMLILGIKFIFSVYT